jgi:hypothetical protein
MRIDGVPSVVGGDMIGANVRFAVITHVPMEVMEDKVAGVIKPRTPPERIRNPGIQVIIRLRRRVVSYHRGAVITIVIVDHLGSRTRDGTFGRRLHLLFRRLARSRGMNRFTNHFDAVPVFLGDGFVLIGEMNDPVFVDIFINDGVAFGGSGRLRRRIDVQAQLGLEVSHRLESLILAHLQLAALDCRSNALFDLDHGGRRHGVTRDPAVLGLNAHGAQLALRLGFILRRPHLQSFH